MKKIPVIILLAIILVGFLAYILINLRVVTSTSKYIFPTTAGLTNSQAVLILGARVFPETGSLSDILKDRVITAVKVYNENKADRILISGDHGRTDYDEVNVIKDYIVELGVPEEDIFLDHAGFDTYDSIYRAKEIFEVESLIISTQKFHLPRAVYIAREIGIEAQGIEADQQEYRDALRNELRESLARSKSFIDLLIKASPQHLGEKIPITGDASLSWD